MRRAAEEARVREAEEARVREAEEARVREAEEARVREAEEARVREAEAAVALAKNLAKSGSKSMPTPARGMIEKPSHGVCRELAKRRSFWRRVFSRPCVSPLFKSLCTSMVATLSDHVERNTVFPPFCGCAVRRNYGW